MTRVRNSLLQFSVNDGGATAIEYALIAGIVSIAIVTSLTQVGTQLNGLFTYISAKLQSATN